MSEARIERSCANCKWSGIDEAEIPLIDRRNPLIALRRQIDPVLGWLCLHPSADRSICSSCVKGGVPTLRRMSCAEARILTHPNQYTTETFWCGVDGRYWQSRSPTPRRRRTD
jgi:hypothetical protein